MKLPDIDQKWFNENRARFNAETHTFTLPENTHKHTFYRKSPIEIACRTCGKVWRDMGKIKLTS